MQQTLHIGEEIRKRLQERERTIGWLAKKLNYDRSNLWKQLQCPHIHAELIYRISLILCEDFFSYYTQQLSKDLKVNDNTQRSII